jgi:sigma-54-specific transcriptional regulator
MTANVPPLLSFPEGQLHPLSVRARALVFEDPRSRAVLETLERVAPSDASVLIIGATGTGKELIARHVHQHSGRSGPFVAVNCGAFNETLIESELFGYEAGAFTGAHRARGGWFEAAQGGTLFLDEIGDLPLSQQVKLLRVLQERQVVRVGSRRPIDVDVRLVAATNVELSQAVEAGHFRRDLWYRLNVATVQLPALYERPGDILPLARHFIRVYCTKLGLPLATLSPDGIDALMAYAWPGNIRELENVIHYALLVGNDGCIRAGDLKIAGAQNAVLVRPPPSGAPHSQSIEDAATEAPVHRLDSALRDLMERNLPDLNALVEARLIHTAFDFCEHNQVRTARLLGISRNVLRTQLIRFGHLQRTGERQARRPPVSPQTAHKSPALPSERVAAAVEP